MKHHYDSIEDTAETPLLKKEEGSLGKRRFSLGFVGALLVAAVLGTVAVQHIAVPRQAPLSEASTGVVSTSTPRLHADIGATPSAIASAHESGEPDSLTDTITSEEEEDFAFDEAHHFEDDDEEEAQSGLVAGLGSSIKSAASLGKCKDKKVGGCAIHKKKKCGWLWYDNGCSSCNMGYKKNGDWSCQKCGDKKVSNCMLHKKEGCGGLWYDNGRCETCKPGYGKTSDTYCHKCYDKKVSGCLFHKKEGCGTLWYDNGKCETCMTDYNKKSDTVCEKCGDKNVAGCLLPEKDFCGSPPVIAYDNGKCHSCVPGCQKSSDKKSCDCQFWEDQWEQVKEDPLGYAEDRLDDIKEGVAELNEHIQDTIESLKNFFGGLECDVDMDVLKEMFNTFQDNVTPDFSSILDVFKGKQDDFVKGLGGPLCDFIWTMAIPQASIVLDAVNAVVEMVDKHCPALKIDMNNKVPTVTIGFTLDVGAENGFQTASAGAEIGLGFTLRGDKICYVGGCVESGFKIQAVPDPAFGVDAGIAVTLFDDIGSVPGSSETISLGVGIDLPAPVNFGGEAAVSLVSSGGNLIGVSVPLGVEPSVGPDMEFSFAEGLCLTPVCVTTDGNHCSEQYTPVEENAKSVEEIFGAEAVAKYEEAKPPPPPPPPASKKKKSKKISWKKILG